MDLSAITITHEWLTAKCPMRPDNGHKGTFGRVLIYAGSEGMGGAAYMAASSALSSGAGLVYVMTEKQLVTPLMTMCPEALGIAIPEEKPEKDFSSVLSDKDACLMGPGIPKDRPDLERNILTAAKEAKHLVLDAGALSLLSENRVVRASVSARKALGLSPAVLTPHLGEFKRILPSWQEGDMAGAGAFAEEKGVVLVLKSNETNIFTPDGKWYSNPKGNSGLAKGGSGDVLAGLLTGLLAQGMTEEDAAVCAVGIHSLAAEMCAAEHGKRAMRPTMLRDYYGKCFKMLKWEEGM